MSVRSGEEPEGTERVKVLEFLLTLFYESNFSVSEECPIPGGGDCDTVLCCVAPTRKNLWNLEEVFYFFVL